MLYCISRSRIQAVVPEMTDPTAEIDALRAIAEALAPLDTDARSRVLRWATDRFMEADGTVVPTKPQAAPASPSYQSVPEPQATAASPSYQSMAELYAAANPTTDPERALVAAYWFQVVEGHDELEAQQLNSELKHLGHQLSNVTRALGDLKKRRPQLIVQTRKSGNTKQARKKYRLTTAGRDALEAMISGQQNGSEQ